MEVELEPRVKALPYKVKAMSRESPSQKALHVLDSDLRTHWSTATNTKEWILLELHEPCLLSHIRIYNKSVLEWEIAVGLRYKPETFQKVRPRCEAPRRDMIYPTNYTPSRYVRISCLRGNPIAIFFVQLIGVSVAGLEPEFQPVVNHLLPHIISHKQDPQDMHLQLLQDMTNRLLVFLPQLEADLTSFPDSPESNLRFLAMLAGPLYPILYVVNERTTSKPSGNISDLDVSKSSQLSPALTVSSNFEPRRSRNASPLILSGHRAVVFRSDAIFVLLRKAYKDSDLNSVCKTASRIMEKLINPDTEQDVSNPQNDVTSTLEEKSNLELSSSFTLVDYSDLFGDEFQMPDEHWDCSYLNILDIGAVEEGILHVLYACASQPVLCSKMAERASDFWAALPLVQALLPALRPLVSNPFEVVDETFSQWKQPIVQQALSQIVTTATSDTYRSLLHACAGYLSSYSPSHARAACVLIDLCSGVLAPWMTQVIAKVDLALELLEDLLGVIQDARISLVRARAALKYILLALSGHMDYIMGKYKEVKHRILFLVEMLEPFLDPAIAASKSKIAFGDLSSSFPEKQEQNCMIALNVIRTAVQKPAVLPSLESEWRLGSVAPSVLLSILEPHMPLPPDVDLCKSASKPSEPETASVLNGGGGFPKPNSQYESDGKTDVSETAGKSDSIEDRNLLFAPSELQSITLTNFSNIPNQSSSVANFGDMSLESRQVIEKHSAHHFPTNILLDAGLRFEYFNLQADYFQLLNNHDCDLRASEFRRLALDLHSRNDTTVESHDAAIDALLLAAECHVNPYFMLSIGASSKLVDLLNINDGKALQSHGIMELNKGSGMNKTNLEAVANIERKRDKLVFHILLEAAELDKNYHSTVSDEEGNSYSAEGFDEQVIKLSPLDVQYADALTLVRQNQALLCNFLIRRLLRDQTSMHEILLQCLVYFLHSGTKLYCSPEHVIDIILKYAEDLNKMLGSFHDQLKEGSLHLAQERIHAVERRWSLLQQLVFASSNGDEKEIFGTKTQNNYLSGNLIPSSAWMQKISQFSGSSYPLVRFLGWMAVSRNAKQYMKDQTFLASDLSQLTYLLSIFADDLASIDNVVNRKYEEDKLENLRGEHGSSGKSEYEQRNQNHNRDHSFRAIYPELWKFFPNMKRQFETFGEAILEAVGLQLRSVSSSQMPDVLCWFSELCSWPFSSAFSIGNENLKGYNAKNARAIILYILESIIVEHMEAMVPETPKLVQVLVSLSSAAYCDVSFLDSVLCLLKPIISYSLSKISDVERLSRGDSCLNFEELCFNVLFDKIKQKNEIEYSSDDNGYNVALAIFILASIFPDLSFHYKRDFLQSLLNWTNFAVIEPTTSFYDYLRAFQCVMDNCRLLLVNTLKTFGLIPLQLPPIPCVNSGDLADDSSKLKSWFLSDVCNSENDVHKIEMNSSTADVDQCELRSDDLEGISKDIEGLINVLSPAIERCWNLHHLLARKLTIASAECLVLSKCLASVSQKFPSVDDDQNSSPDKSSDLFTLHWKIGLEGLSELIFMLQESSCWEVSCLMLDCLLGVPYGFCLDNVIGMICSAIKNVSCCAPKICWRLQSDKWLSSLIARGIYFSRESELPLIDLFCTLLGHAEPEQRIIAIKHLGKLLGQCANGERAIINSKFCTDLVPKKLAVSVPDHVLSHLVSNTWDEVVVLASSNSSLQIRVHAMALLSNYIPFAERHQLQSFLMAVDTICCLSNTQPSHEGPVLQLSLALLACACLYSPPKDISLIPQHVWSSVEDLGSIKHDGRLGDIERRTCQVLCRLRDEGDEAKTALKEALSSTSTKQYDPDFANTRESVLQVLTNLTAVHSYFDMFSKKIDQDDMEVEEAELELDIIQKEHTLPKRSEDSKDGDQIHSLPSSGKDVSRLQQIRESIRSLEKSKLKEDILARRQKKLLMRHARQKYLEEATLREAELLQELDRERAAEMEKELERQRLLEIERAKTRELRHNLDMEKERQTQRDLQREIEQAESGIRPSRRDYPSSTHGSRPRDRFRERDNARSGNEGGSRASTGSLQPEIPSNSSSIAASPTIVLSSSRAFSGQPTILQSRDRQDDSSSMYEENIDGSKDSGDTGSIGDPELVSAFDGQSGGYGSQRHSSRGSKSRQLGERRERDNRREGKWERKH